MLCHEFSTRFSSEVPCARQAIVYAECKGLALAYEGHSGAVAGEQLRQRFLEETGWQFVLGALRGEAREGAALTGSGASAHQQFSVGGQGE